MIMGVCGGGGGGQMGVKLKKIEIIISYIVGCGLTYGMVK